MKKIIVIVLVLFTGYLLYYFIGTLSRSTKVETKISTAANTSKKSIRPDDNLQHKYSMKQIDSISANLNYKFTIDNKIPDSISNPPVEKPKHIKKTAGK